MTPQNPVNPYGASKAMVERILCDYQRAHQIGTIALRYFNASGADPDSELGELRDPETHLIPLLFRAIRTGEREFMRIPMSCKMPNPPTKAGSPRQ